MIFFLELTVIVCRRIKRDPGPDRRPGRRENSTERGVGIGHMQEYRCCRFSSCRCRTARWYRHSRRVAPHLCATTLKSHPAQVARKRGLRCSRRTRSSRDLDRGAAYPRARQHVDAFATRRSAHHNSARTVKRLPLPDAVARFFQKRRKIDNADSDRRLRVVKRRVDSSYDPRDKRPADRRVGAGRPEQTHNRDLHRDTRHVPPHRSAARAQEAQGKPSAYTCCPHATPVR